ncbi:MAG: methionine aminotransferase [Ideonella sp. MAG2]|nr:MAG: methionine aminotransferase [Ideonella sp. MAG2]
MAHLPSLHSRLPHVGTTIFSVMSALAAEHRAVNLGQGFPDFDCDPALVDAVHEAMKSGHNQYPPMPGVPLLRQRIADKLARQYGRAADPDTEITITAGATQAILTALLALVHPGDEVIVLEPCYDSYGPAIDLAGGKTVRVALDPITFRPDFDRLRSAMTAKTRAVIVNSPHNPTGVVWRHDEWDALAECLRGTSAWLISDEVYEHMVFDAHQHGGVWGHPELAHRSLMISSFGKSYHVTGWKLGFVAAPAALTVEFRKVHQFNVFTVNTPMQYGLAAFMANPHHHENLSAFYQAKRDHFCAGLAQTPLRLLPCEGTYFVCAEYEAISRTSDSEFCRWLTTDVGVAAIPLSAFYAQAPTRQRIRFCFAKQTATLDLALQRLRALTPLK